MTRTGEDDRTWPERYVEWVDHTMDRYRWWVLAFVAAPCARLLWEQFR